MTDIQTIEVTSEDEMDMEMVAKQTAETLCRYYPSHLWAVGWAPGRTLVIKNMAMDGRYGFTVDANKAYSASDLQRQIMLAGGELLERCGMVRGKWNGELATHMDKN